MDIDRAKMNRAIFPALKSGGTYIVADHSGRAGTGTAETKTLHRIDEATVRSEVQAAGFRFVSEGGFLRNPQDPRTAPSGKASIASFTFAKFSGETSISRSTSSVARAKPCWMMANPPITKYSAPASFSLRQRNTKSSVSGNLGSNGG